MPEKILAVRMDNPQDVVEVARVLDKENLAIEALGLAPGDREACSMLLVDDPEGGLEALRSRGHLADLVDAVLLMAPTEAGDVHLLLSRMSDAGVEIGCALTTRHGRILVGVDDVAKAIDAVGGAAVTGR